MFAQEVSSTPLQIELSLLDDMVHYMKYAMGIYGWTLHVFSDPCCGLCEICSITW